MNSYMYHSEIKAIAKCSTIIDGINRYGNTCTYMEAEYLQKEENSYHIWLSCLVLFVWS